MNIFCKETQEHLQQIRQQMEDSSPTPEKTNQILITPDLWMKKLEDSKKMRDKALASISKEVKSEDEEDKDEEALDLTETNGDKKPEVKEPTPQSDAHEPAPDHPTLMEKLDRRYRESRVRRVRARDSVSTPLSVNSSPGSSRVSHSPSAASAAVTPPAANTSAGMPPLGSLLGALGPGFPGHPLLYHHLLASGAPGLLPPGLLPLPDQQSRPSNVRMLPTIESSQTSPRSSSNHPASQSTTTAHPTPPGMAFPHRPPHPGLIPGLPPGLPMPGALPPGMVPPPMAPGILPPNTLMSPYPVFVPLPVPVPIVIPVKTDKDFNTLANMYSPKKAAPVPKTDHIKREPVRPESLPAPSTMMSDNVSVKSDTPPTSASVPLQCTISNDSDSLKDRIMCACCQVSNPNDECSKGATDPSCSDSHGRRSATLENTSPLSMHSDIQDGVIDLSKDKSISEKPPVLSNIDQNKNRMIVIKPSPPLMEGEVTSPLVPPMIGGHLMPPRDHSYSSRRGLILDAPSVPRNRNKSPSPEKRILLRSPTRDMLFAKRRCLRRSIKTK